MKYFQPSQLTSSKRPKLLPKESLLLQQAHTGLYEGKAKLEGYQDGVLYLTSHRIIYVDSRLPTERSADIPIKAITTIDQYGGFLRSSPKLILYLDPIIFNNTQYEIMSDSDSLSTQAAKTRQLAAVVGIWTCPICSHDNTSLTEKCDLCGVRTVHPPVTLTNNDINTSSSSNSNTKTQQQELSSPCSPPISKGTCPTCTFINHPSMIQCEMCDTQLVTSPSSSLPSLPPRPSMDSLEKSTSSLLLSSSSSSPIEKEDNYVQLSFRKGGLGQFLAKLNTAISNKSWDSGNAASSSSLLLQQQQQQQHETSVAKLDQQQQQQQRRAVGIQGIQQRIDQMSTEANDTMTDAFQDLDRLMAKANEMVTLAETISNKMSKDPNDAELSTLRNYMLNLGISNPVTKGTAGSIYHQELSRELAEFLDKLYTRKDNDIRPLTEIYCIFNRARGVALISPEDLFKACQQFELLDLPFRMRQLSTSSVLVVQSTHMSDITSARRIKQHVQLHRGHLTALQLAELEHWALAVALEQLLMMEQQGILCRDDGPGGLVFYENWFTD